MAELLADGGPAQRAPSRATSIDIRMTIQRSRRILPWLVFGGGFLLTTGIGATIIGLSDGRRWGIDELRQRNLQINMDALAVLDFRGTDYWLLLALCVSIPALGIIFYWLVGSPGQRATPPCVIGPALPVARLFFACGIAWILGRVFLGLPNALESIVGAWTGDIEYHYKVRYSIMAVLSPQEFGMAYTGLLILLTIPLRRALVTSRTWEAWIEFGVWILAYEFLAIVLIQKLLVSQSLLVIALSLCTAKNFVGQWKRLGLVCGLFFLLIHLAMSSLVSSWSATSTVDHIIGRSADSYPYAIAIGPQHSFGIGQYIVGSLLGGPHVLGTTAQYNIDLYKLMYPKNEGAVSLAAPVWSYCDVGIWGAVITMLIISGICSATSSLSRYVDASLWAWSVYILFLVQIYYLTQIPIIGIIFWSYSVVYGIAALGFVRVVATLLPSKTAPVQYAGMKNS